MTGITSILDQFIQTLGKCYIYRNIDYIKSEIWPNSFRELNHSSWAENPVDLQIALDLVSRFLSSIFCGYGKRFGARACIEVQLTGGTRENIFHSLIATAATSLTEFQHRSDEIRGELVSRIACVQFINYNNRIL